MPAMPLLHRRSVRDLAHSPKPDASHQSEEQPPRPSNATSLAPPTSPRPVSEYARPASRPATATDHADRPTSPTVQPENARTKRFSMLKFRNFSESHLSARAKEDAAKEIIPPMPALSRVNTPAIVKTAPTFDHEQLAAAQSQGLPYTKSLEKTRSQASDMSRLSEDYPRRKDKKSSSKWRNLNRRSTGLEDLQRLSAANANTNKGQDAPPAYGNHLDSDLALPAPRFSESSRSDGSHGSSGDHQIYGSTTTTTHTVSTHTTFFKLPRRNKNRNSLFPLPVKVPSPDPSRLSEGPTTPRASTSGVSIKSQQSTDSRIEPITARSRRHTEASPTRRQAHHNQLASSPHTLVANNSASFSEAGKALEREETQRSRDSSFSSPLRPPMRFGLRDRAATTSSWGRGSMDTPQGGGSGRTSISTTGRSSFGGFLGLSRFRHDSGPHSPRNGSPASRSKSNSFAMSREALVVVPEREEGDTPGKYLERLEAAVNRSMIAGILSKSSDPFAQAVLRSYTRRFPFFGEPIDMSLRKFLLEADLPKETQQVDRVIQAFADRYHECNPGIFMSSDQAYIIAFSLMMLHTDAFNRNNKRKMQKQDYIKNTSGQHVSEDVLACFYDNICYTPFVHYEEEVDINGERVLPFKSKKSKLKGAITDSGKKVSGPVDPYNLLVDQKLDLLRPPIKDSFLMEDPYNYIGSQGSFDMQYLQRAFTHTGTLQIISARSRPAAYEGQVNTSNPHSVETQQGIVDLKVTKVGTLWRKAVKKKKARSPWQEWGAILTGSQLYLFKNASWVKGLVHQFMSHQRQGAPRMPVTFSPPLHDFKPDALIKTDDAVALIDATYVRHKHAFTFVRHGGQEEVLLADNESELNDWLSLINYAAAFRAAGVRIRGMICGSEECNRPHDHHRPESSHTTHSPTREGAKSPVYDIGLTRQVMTARRQIMMQKIGEYDKELASLQKQHDDILRNARHLLVLSPIPPKTREDIVHAAGRTDAALTWVRRDIWRMRCHRDILALDIQQDGNEVGGVKPSTERKSEKQTDAPDTAKKVLPRLPSHLSSRSPRSQPQSPHSPASGERSPGSMRPRPSTTDSMDTFVDDVFRSTIESPSSPGGDGWRLPPLQFDVEQQRDKHRGSIASTLLSAASGTSQRQPSWSASSTSSRQPQRLNSPDRSESLRIITPTTSTGREDLGSRPQEEVRTPDSGASRPMNLDGVVSTPESDRTARGKRRSLQKTLRDHHTSLSQRHRRNKESESTVRSADGEASDHPEATPGLERAQGRFILHGKQASVVQFGSDWPTERMRLRREKWHREHSQPGSPGKEDGDRASEFPLGSPAVQDLNDDDESTTATRSISTVESFVDALETRRTMSGQEAAGADGDSGSANGFDPYDLSWDPRSEKRVTVIGPPPNLNIPSSPPALGSMLDEEEEQQSDYEDAKENRRTVIAPPAFVFPDNRNATDHGSDLPKDGPSEEELRKASVDKSA